MQVAACSNLHAELVARELVAISEALSPDCRHLFPGRTGACPPHPPPDGLDRTATSTKVTDRTGDRTDWRHLAVPA